MDATLKQRVLIAAGTMNPSKVAGIRAAFTEILKVSVEVIPVSVDSGVPPQPIGIDEILKGARNRCFGALAKVRDAEFGVGVEAGIYGVEDKYYDVQAAVVCNASGKLSVGFSPSFQIPPSFAEALTTGKVKELEVIVDSYFGTKDIGEKGGLIKMLTRGVMTREHLTRDAVITALIPWINEGLYFRET